MSYLHYIYMQNSFLELPAFLMETEASLVQGHWQLIITPATHHKLLLLVTTVFLKNRINTCLSWRKGYITDVSPPYCPFSSHFGGFGIF